MPREGRIGIDPAKGGLFEVGWIIKAPKIARGCRIALGSGTEIEAACAGEITA
jgi:hypothetical protein